jgi:peptidoglycan/LPS O-acetylase OafA/YrhL
MKTLGTRLEECGGFGPRFNLVRIVLAYGVLLWHTVAIATNSASDVLQTVIWPAIFAVLPMFFSLSGFLVAGSALRLPIREYILNRAFRIVPALGVDIFLCALVLGPVFTTYALEAYFTNSAFYVYFANIFGWISYELPGVFEGSPYPRVVNGALWTVPYEIACYAIMSGLIVLGLMRRPLVTLCLTVLIPLVAIVLHVAGYQASSGSFQKAANFFLFTKGASLIPAFLLGACLYLLKDHIVYSPLLAGMFLIIFVGVGFYANPSSYTNPIFISLATFPLCYIVVQLGLMKLPTSKTFERGDYSYGVYLYHFPILQAMQQVFDFDAWWKLALAGSIIVTIFAVFSWHIIEKPILKQRKRFSFVGARIASNSRRFFE